MTEFGNMGSTPASEDSKTWNTFTTPPSSHPSLLAANTLCLVAPPPAATSSPLSVLSQLRESTAASPSGQDGAHPNPPASITPPLHPPAWGSADAPPPARPWPPCLSPLGRQISADSPWCSWGTSWGTWGQTRTCELWRIQGFWGHSAQEDLGC